MTAMMRLGFVLLLCGLATSLSDQLTGRDKEFKQKLGNSDELRESAEMKQGMLRIYKEILDLGAVQKMKEEKVSNILGQMQIKAEDIIIKLLGRSPFSLTLEGTITKNGNDIIFTAKSTRNFIGFTFTVKGVTSRVRSVETSRNLARATIDDITGLLGTLETSTGDTFIINGNSVTRTADGLQFSSTGISEAAGVKFDLNGNIVVNADETKFTMVADGAMLSLEEPKKKPFNIQDITDFISSMVSKFLP